MSFHENDQIFNRNCNQRLNIKLPYLKFRQARSESDKVFRSTVIHQSFRSVFTNISTPLTQPSVRIRTEPNKYAPQFPPHYDH